MPPPAVVRELVERFESNRESYHSDQYNEAQLREEFLNPFFEALGWDVYNRKGYAEAYKEVIHEAAIKVGGRTKAPDYCFRAGGGVRSFFVEAKKPAVDIREAVAPAYQLRRYAWSAKLPVSILTDFEEFAVYDCRVRPMQTDRASTARILCLKYSEYLERWDDLAGRFSPEAIRKGALDRFVASRKIKKGTAEVDAAFLGEIESWRDALARNIALRNPDLSQRDLNFAVQRTIDRLVFLRICEDRGIEPYGTLQALGNGSNIYGRLREMFQRADERYNSGLFHFSDEKGRSEPPDELTLTLAIDDRALKKILKNLYYPESPYEFSVFPAEILGQVYEQFLGKVIRLTSGHRAVVEDKPEVKKAGGVYYTPSYIVDYIVEHTVGKLLEGETEGGKRKRDTGARLTPAQAAKVKILDPACGSGSFLIGTYRYLLDWHRDRYVEDGPEKHARGRSPRLYRGTGGDWRLTTAERRRILLNNIYGVDIDPQAVEVTKLSLVLKVLEGETQQTLTNQLRLFHERALPDLGANIKCGNSLIGPDFYHNRQKSLLDEDEVLRINAFDWKAEFPTVFKGPNPGFDAVIGNPPWGARLDDAERAYLRSRYSRVVARMVDSYLYFLDQGIRLANEGGPVGFIIPSTLLNQVDAEPTRSLLLERGVSALVSLGQRVFGAKVLNTSTIVVTATPSHQRRVIVQDISRVPLGDRPIALKTTATRSWEEWKTCVEQDAHRVFYVGGSQGTLLFNKLRSRMERFKDVLSGNIERGVSPDVVAAHVLTQEDRASRLLERQLLRPSVSGPKIKRYHAWNVDQFIVYTTRSTPIKEFPKALDHLSRFRAANTCREVKEGKHPWWALHRPRDPSIFESPKFIGLTTCKTIELIYDPDSSVYVTDAMYVFRTAAEYDPFTLMAIMQSRVFLFLYRVANQGDGRVIPQVKASKLYDLPYPCDVPRHEALSSLAERMIAYRTRLGRVRTSHEQRALERQIEATDREIDRVVYELYGLTEEEIRIVEESVGAA